MKNESTDSIYSTTLFVIQPAKQPVTMVTVLERTRTKLNSDQQKVSKSQWKNPLLLCYNTKKAYPLYQCTIKYLFSYKNSSTRYHYTINHTLFTRQPVMHGRMIFKVGGSRFWKSKIAYQLPLKLGQDGQRSGGAMSPVWKVEGPPPPRYHHLCLLLCLQSTNETIIETEFLLTHWENKETLWNLNETSSFSKKN